MCLTPNDVQDLKVNEEDFDLLVEAEDAGLLDEEEFFELLEIIVREREEIECLPDDFEFDPPEPRELRTIDSFAESDITHLFRFKDGAQLRRLMAAIDLPDFIRLNNNIYVTKEEMLLVGLKRLAYPTRLIDLVQLFGGDISLWSRCCKYFVNHVFDKFSPLLLDRGLERFIDSFDNFTELIKQKIIEKGVTHVNRAELSIVLIGFIDNCIFHSEVCYLVAILKLF